MTLVRIGQPILGIGSELSLGRDDWSRTSMMSRIQTERLTISPHLVDTSGTWWIAPGVRAIV